jgi:hypothetical protein
MRSIIYRIISTTINTCEITNTVKPEMRPRGGREYGGRVLHRIVVRSVNFFSEIP